MQDVEFVLSKTKQVHPLFSSFMPPSGCVADLCLTLPLHHGCSQNHCMTSHASCCSWAVYSSWYRPSESPTCTGRHSMKNWNFPWTEMAAFFKKVQIYKIWIWYYNLNRWESKNREYLISKWFQYLPVPRISTLAQTYPWEAIHGCRRWSRGMVKSDFLYGRYSMTTGNFSSNCPTSPWPGYIKKLPLIQSPKASWTLFLFPLGNQNLMARWMPSGRLTRTWGTTVTGKGPKPESLMVWWSMAGSFFRLIKKRKC